MKVKTVEVEIRRDVTHSVVKTVPVYEAECLKAVYGDGVVCGKAGKPMAIEGVDAELERVRRVYGSMTNSDGQAVGVVAVAFGTDAAARQAIEDATVKQGGKAAG